MFDDDALREQYEQEFDKLKHSLDSFKLCISDLIDELDIGKALVTARVKTVEEFINKSRRTGKDYTDPMIQITDQVGLRVVVEYQDYEEQVTNRLKEVLKVDEENTRETKEDLEEQEFGYLATHIIATLPYEIAAKYRLRHLKNKKFEIQIRTRLNDVWAERSHELTYKKISKDPLKRRLAAVAAGLEMLDEEYVRLRDMAKQDIAECGFQAALAQEPIDINTLGAFLSSGDIITELRNKLKKQGITLSSTVRDEFLSPIANDPRKWGAVDVDEAIRFFKEHNEGLAKAIKLYLDENKRTAHHIDTALTAGMSIVLLNDEQFQKRTERWENPWKSGVREAYSKFHN